jgi:H/ACA ribonucleoprotein complex subunit 4
MERNMESGFEREILIRLEDVTDPSHGCSPLDRPIQEHLKYGVINLDKPSGPSSHEIVAWVKRLLQIGHAGHSGTLDPKVTGVLPIGLEEATRAIGLLLLANKEYVCVLRLHEEASDERIREVLNEFVGEIYQRPPIRSSVQRILRTRRIYYLDDIEIKGQLILFRVGCQSGTYIRKLCFDIGEALGTGGHMDELRRTKSGPFTEDEGLVTLYDLKGAFDHWRADGDESRLRICVQPMENSLRHLPRIFIRDSAVDAVCHGAKLAVPGISKLDSKISSTSTVGIYTLKGELIAIGKALLSTEQILNQEHGIAIEPNRVIMPSGTYPKMWHAHNHSSQS